MEMFARAATEDGAAQWPDADRSIDAEVADAVVQMFLPQMPDVGRQAGFVGPAVEIEEGASAMDVLLGAMGRDPRR